MLGILLLLHVAGPTTAVISAVSWSGRTTQHGHVLLRGHTTVLTPSQGLAAGIKELKSITSCLCLDSTRNKRLVYYGSKCG